MPKISQPTIEALMVPLPPLSVQHEASATLDLASSQADAIECAWQNATNRSSRLRAALLRSAFEARLIAPEQPARAPAA